MKDLFKESWGHLQYDEKNQRLVLSMHELSFNQFRHLIDQAVTAVEHKEADNCLIDLTKRSGSTKETMDYSVTNFKTALDHGLKRLAILKPKDQKEQTTSQQFIDKIGSTNVRLFDKKEDALQWLDQLERGKKAA